MGIRIKDVLFGAGLGSGLMYLFDPSRGRRRRAMVTQQFIHATHKSEIGLEKAVNDAVNRTRGILYEVFSIIFRRNGDDRVKTERVRSMLGRIVRHPHAIQVKCEGGRVILSGPILADEVDKLIAHTLSVRGVKEIDNKLEIHNDPSNVPALQGNPPKAEERFEFAQRNWSPTGRTVAAGLGGILAVSGFRMGFIGLPLSLIGLGLFARAASNKELKMLVGIGAGRRAVDIHKTINVHAPIEKVYDFWSHFENFPQFMSNVRDVRKTATENQWHWVVSALGGSTVEWNAEVTEQIPNKVLAWKTTSDSIVQHAGIIHFNQVNGSTQVDIRLSYNPSLGVLGHAVAKIIGSDPKAKIESDLVRAKTFLETGHVAHDAARHQ